MDKLKLLIADSDTRFTEYLLRSLKSCSELEIVSVEANGIDALNAIRSNPPDAVLFDLLLPGMDGLSLLRSINELPDPPVSLCCTRFYTDVMLEALRSYGATYLLYKPFDPATLYPVLLSCVEMQRSIRSSSHALAWEAEDSPSRSAFIRNYIISLGVPSRLSGCAYLTEAVRLAQKDASLMSNLAKGLYLEIGRFMDTTPVRIERCIRNAISAAYQRSELRLRMPSCPSNKEFINYILRNIPD